MLLSGRIVKEDQAQMWHPLQGMHSSLARRSDYTWKTRLPSTDHLPNGAHSRGTASKLPGAITDGRCALSDRQFHHNTVITIDSQATVQVICPSVGLLSAQQAPSIG